MSDSLTKLQERFCQTHQVYMTCMGRDREILAPTYGTPGEKQFLMEHMEVGTYGKLFDVLLDNKVERVMELPLEKDYMKLWGVAVPINGKTEIVWMVVGVIKELLPFGVMLPEGMMVTSTQELEDSVAFLEFISGYLAMVQQAKREAASLAEKSRGVEAELKERLRQSETLTSILYMLESEESFTDIATEVLKYTCDYLKNTGAFLIKADSSRKQVELICEHVTNPALVYQMPIHHFAMDKLPFFNGRPYMISQDTPLPANFREFFGEMGWGAAIFLPMEMTSVEPMYLGFYQKKGRNWTVDEIQFVNDVKRILQSILNKRIANNSLASSYAALEAILEQKGNGVLVWDEGSDHVLYRNQEFLHMMEEEFEVKEDLAVQRAKEFFLAKEEGEVLLARLGHWVDYRKSKIQWVDGRSVHLLSVYDVTEKKLYQQKIEKQANNDFLTGLYNRMRCEQDLEGHLQRARESGEPGAVLYIDLDDFKHINDGLGMQYGDVLLKAISKSLREIPKVDKNCYRMGGDEFIILIAGDAYQSCDDICKEIREIFMKPWYLKGGEYYCTMSMGIAKYPKDGDTVEELIQKADAALFEAKRTGKNRICTYCHDVEGGSYHRLDMEKNMRNATKNSCEEFEVYYQPIMDMNKPGHPCCGAEALVRWNSKSMGFLSPDDFIPLAEYLGLINPIGDYVLSTAAKCCKSWNDLGHPEYKVNVNLSVMQLLQVDIVERIENVLKETRVNPANLTLEVTESLAINDMERMKAILGQIKALGVRVALDDFGTGFSSLNHIREMPIDVIKIDRCFIENIPGDSYAGTFVNMVAELAGTVGMQVCVEGVEYKEQVEELEKMPIRLMQGYYYGKPMPKEEFEKRFL